MLEVSHEKFIPSLIQRQFLQNDRIWFSYDEKPIANRLRSFTTLSCIFVKPKSESFCGMKAKEYVVEYGVIHGAESYCGGDQSYFLVTCNLDGHRQSVLFKNNDLILKRFFVELNDGIQLAEI